MTRQRLGVSAVIGSSLAIFFPGAMTFGYPGVMGPYWQKTFGVGKGAIGLSLFFLLAMVGIFSFTAGKVQEKYGTRVVIRIGSAIVGLAAVVSAFASNIYMIYAWAALNGTGASLIYIPGLTTVQKWFPEKRGLVSGIVNLSFAISAAIMAPVFAYMFKLLPYQTMNLVIGFAALVVCLVGANFTEVPERSKFAESPVPSRAAQPAHGGDAAVRGKDRSFSVREAVQTRAFWFIWGAWAFVGASCMSMVTLSTALGLSRGFSFSDAVLILTSFNLTNGLIRFLAGYLSDIVGRKPLMAISFFAAGIAFFWLPHLSGLGGICALALVIGLAFGTLFAVSAPLVTDCFGLKHFGAIYGLTFTAYGFVAGVLGPALSGHLLDSGTVTFDGVFAYLGLLAVTAGILISLVVPPKVVMLEDKVLAKVPVSG